MPVTVNCPNCRAPLVVDDALLNGPVRCGPCQTVFVATGGYSAASGPVPEVASGVDPSEGQATASLVLGIVSLVIGCIPFFGPIIAIVGIVLGIRAAGSPTKGGHAAVGIVLCVIGLLIGGLSTIGMIMLFADDDPNRFRMFQD